MKRIIDVIFTARRITALPQNLTKDLRAVFGDLIEIRFVYLETLAPDEKIEGDVVLLMRSGIIPHVEERVADKNRIVVVTRTVSEASIYSIYDLPRDLKVLVVNDTPETTNETVAMLYQLGITHLKLIPYLGEQTDISDVKVAITPGEPHLVPNHIKHILDIGDRRLDMQTFLDIFSIINIATDGVKEALIQYSAGIIELRNGVKKRYVQNYIQNEMLKQVIALEDTGVLVTDTQYHVKYWNTMAEKILEKAPSYGKPFSDYLSESQFLQISAENFSKELMYIQAKEVMVTSVVLRTMNENTGYYLRLEPAAQIRKSGSELSRRLQKQGLIAKYQFGDILHRSEKMKQSVAMAKKVAQTDYTILITGATGTGKELFAQAIHNASLRKNEPFVAVNCAALPESILESELFGYEEGAFTGAKRGGKPGLFESANNGTIFLDEIGDMPYSLQSRLLRVLQEQQVVRLGGSNVININVRILTATNCNLQEAVAHKTFREDLFYRLNVFPLVLPSLAERREDILLIFSYLLGCKEESLPEDVKKQLLSHHWPGNIRELHNVAEYYKLMGNVACIQTIGEARQNPPPVLGAETGIRPASALELYHTLKVMQEHAASGRSLGRNSLLEKLKMRQIFLSEKKIEKILSFLVMHCYIERGKGRTGICIRESGIDYLRALKREIDLAECVR